MNAQRHHCPNELLTAAQLAVAMNYTTTYLHRTRREPTYPRDECEQKVGNKILFDAARFARWYRDERPRKPIGRPSKAVPQSVAA